MNDTSFPGAENVPVSRPDPRPTTADVVTRAASIDRGDLQKVTKSLIDETLRRQDALNAAEDEEARLWFVTKVLDVVERYPAAKSIDVVDWEDEVEEGQPFDVDLQEIYDEHDELIADIGGQSGAISIRHHWVLDDLRVDPEGADGNKYDSRHRISVAKAIAWLEELLAERL